jgi:hypothetical protein
MISWMNPKKMNEVERPRKTHSPNGKLSGGQTARKKIKPDPSQYKEGVRLQQNP